MKYLDGYPELDLLSKSLSFSSPSLRVSTRIEAYSCKAISREKKLFRLIENDVLSDLSLHTSISPPEHHSQLVSSAFGPLDQKDSRKTLWLLIATLNIAFPDHDFSTLNAEEFVREESARMVLASLTSALSHLRSSNGQEGTPAMPLPSMGLNMGIGMVAAGQGAGAGQHYNGGGKAGSAGSGSAYDLHRGYSTSAPSHAHGHGHSHGLSQTNGGKKGSSSPRGTHKALPDQSGGSASTSTGGGGAVTRKGRSGSTSAAAVAGGSGTSGSASTSAAGAGAAGGPSTSSTSSSTALAKKERKHSAPVTHTALISKLRNDLDGSYDVPTHPLLRQVLDPIIDLSECEVYSYTPDLDSDPHAYQSDEEEDDDDGGGDDDDDEEGDDGSGDGGYDDAPDMDFDETDYQESVQGNDPGMSAVERMAESHGWDMDGVVEGTPSSAPGTPMPAGGGSNPNAATTSRPTSQHKKRGGADTPGATPSSSKKSKQRSGLSRNPSTSTTALASNKSGGSKSGNSIFAGAARGAVYQYGSLDDYSFGHHSLGERQPHHHFPAGGIGSGSGPSNNPNSGGNGDGAGGSLAEEDEDNGGLLWSSNYFFYNRKMKRILFVSCWGRKIGKQFSPSNAVLARSSDNPLHAYRKHQQALLSHQQQGGKHGKVTINLNRASSLNNNNNQSFGADENARDGGAGAPMQSHIQGISKGNGGSSALTNALRASGGAQTPLGSGTATSFSSPPPIANAAAVFRPSSPFPRLDNRGDNPMPPMVRESSNLSISSTAGSAGQQQPQPGSQSQQASGRTRQASTPSRGGGGGNAVGTRRDRSQSSNPNTPTRKSGGAAAHGHRPNKRRAGAGATTGGASPSAASHSPAVGSPASTVARRRRSVVGQ